MNVNMKKGLWHALAIGIFFALTLIYFAPGIFEGKVIQQGDIKKATGMAEELNEYYKNEGGRSKWTGSMFSGMPAYHIQVYGNPPNYLNYLEKPLMSINYFGGSIVLIGLICFYILMCVMGVNRWLAIAGSIAFAFGSYNMIIIMAGHVTKAYVIAYMPLTIAGMILLFREKWLWGAVLFILGVAFSVMNQHPQISYYLAIFCVIFYLGYLFLQIKNKQYSSWIKTGLIMLFGAVLAVLPNAGSLYSNIEMGKESTRGPSELTPVTAEDQATASGGLDKDYAFAWSYGRGELLTLLIPNAYGGESNGALDSQSAFYKEWKKLGQQTQGNVVYAPTYWGEQPFTSGPVYFGALVCFLFVLGMFLIRNPIKWWIAGAAFFFILLSLGNNLDAFNTFFFNYLPMYNKFRVPSMALVIPGMIFPVIGIWGVKELFSKEMDLKKAQKGLIWALSITGGLCLIIWWFPGIFLNFRAAADAGYAQWPEQLYHALIQDRKSLATSDALRSLVFIVLGAGLIFYFLKAKSNTRKPVIVGVGLMLLILVDLWSVGKRYLNYDSFAKETIAQTFKKSVADELILQDQHPSYRVLNLNDPFRESTTSYYHKSIGGYHAVKLRRYQELIDHRLSHEIYQTIIPSLQKASSMEDLSVVLSQCHSLNMLNAKYIVYSPEQPPIVNPFAFGSAWFVDGFKVVENADQEIAALNEINPLTTAVVDKRFAEQVQGLQIVPDSSATMVLDVYKPDRLEYTSKAASEQLAVMSEIYYDHGWKAYIDGKPAPYFRVDWTLRGMRIPAGEHKIEFKFEPDKYNQATMLGSISSGIILLLLLAAIGYYFWSKSRK